MNKTVSRMMAATAALSLVAAPIVAQANTRSGDSGSVYSTGSAMPGLGRADDGEEAGGGLGVGTLIIGFIAVPAIFYGIGLASGVIGDDEEEDGSPGT